MGDVIEYVGDVGANVNVLGEYEAADGGREVLSADDATPDTELAITSLRCAIRARWL